MIKFVKQGLFLLSLLVFLSAHSAPQKVSGETVYEEKCAACHAKGVSGAPKTGDKSDWQPRLEKGIDSLFQNVTNHDYHVTCYKCSDRQVKEAIKYMATQSGGGNRTLW